MTGLTLSTEEEQLIELSYDSSLVQYEKDKLLKFWSSASNEYHAISTAAVVEGCITIFDIVLVRNRLFCSCST